MKISFLMPGYTWSPSGGFKIVYEYANRLVKRGHIVTVVHPRTMPHLNESTSLTARQWLRNKVNLLIATLSEPQIDWHLMDGRVKLAYVANANPNDIPDGDVIFATGWHTCQPVLNCPNNKGVKCYFIQGYEAYHGPKELVDASWRAPLQKVVVSKWLLEVGKELGCEGLFYIPNAIDHDLFRVIHPIEKRTRRVTMLFSTAQIKGAKDGIEALEIAKGTYPELEATLFGVFSRDVGIPSWMKYHRNPKQEFLASNIYSGSSIFLSSSWMEGFSLPPAEAAACGCAIVSTDSGGIREYIQNGSSGLLSAPKDPAALARNLCLLLGDDALRVKLAQAGNASVATLNWERSTDLMEKFMKGIIAGKVSQRLLV